MDASVRAVLTDIEGTTSSIGFVTDTLFPYARARIADYIASYAEDVAPVLAAVPGDTLADKVQNLLRWMDEDAKVTPLKVLQGMIWADGYADGSLTGHVYPDVPAALARWKAAGIDLYVYSSGSVAAQKLIFGHSIAGDLTPMLSGYFDTTTGPKREAESYRKIAEALDLPPGDILFLTDVRAEADAAREAGLQALLIDRDGDGGEISTLAEVLP